MERLGERKYRRSILNSAGFIIVGVLQSSRACKASAYIIRITRLEFSVLGFD